MGLVVGLRLLLVFVVMVIPVAFASDCESVLSAAIPFEMRKIEISAELERSGLQPFQEQLNHAVATLDVYDFYAQYAQSKGYLLGVDSLSESTKLFSSPIHLKHWSDFYREFRIYPKARGHTETVMAELVNSGRLIVFLVPPHLMDEPGLTQNEMLWLLQDPVHRLQNVILVFGAYDFISRANWESFNRTRDWRRLHQALEEFIQQRN